MMETQEMPAMNHLSNSKDASRPIAMNPKKSKISFVLIALAILVGAAGGFAYFTYFQDSFRKLPEFPSETYFSDFKSLSGIHYKLHGKVDASLGWNKDVGRLMSFKVAGDGRRLAVLLPPSLNEKEFSKGQDYVMEVEVTDSGLLDLTRLQKE